MEIAQLYKCAHNNQLQQSINLCHKSLPYLKYGRLTHFSRSHDAHLYPLTIVPTKCQPSSPYAIQEMAQIRF